MKKLSPFLLLTFIFLFATSTSSFAQRCSKETAQRIENGFPKLKYCMENLGWRESVKKNEWRVTVYNTYDDVKVKMEFTLVEKGAAARGLGLYTIDKEGSRSYSFYFSSTPDFIYDNIELIED